MSSSGLLLHAALDAFTVIGGVAAGSTSGLAAVVLITGGGSEELTDAASFGFAISGIFGLPPAIAVFFLELAHIVK